MTAAPATSPDISPEFVAGLAERAREAEELRRLPSATVADFIASGLAELLVPARYGGEQAPWPAILDPVRRMAHGCASSAWTHRLLHPAQLDDGAVRRAGPGRGVRDPPVPGARPPGADGPWRRRRRRHPAVRAVVVGHRRDARQLDHRRRTLRARRRHLPCAGAAADRRRHHRGRVAHRRHVRDRLQ